MLEHSNRQYWQVAFVAVEEIELLVFAAAKVGEHLELPTVQGNELNEPC